MLEKRSVFITVSLTSYILLIICNSNNICSDMTETNKSSMTLPHATYSAKPVVRKCRKIYEQLTLHNIWVTIIYLVFAWCQYYNNLIEYLPTTLYRLNRYLTIPIVEHVVDKEIDKAKLRFGNVTRFPIKDGHDNRESLLLLLVSLK